MACWKTLDKETESAITPHDRVVKSKDCLPSSVSVQPCNRRVGNDHVLSRVEPLVVRIKRRPLSGLRDRTLVRLCRGFENIDLWSGPPDESPIAVLGSRVFLARTGATRESLAREV